MKAVLCPEFGSIANLEYTEVEEPAPGAEDVIIRSQKIGVNYPDGLLVQGLYQAKPEVPFIPGMEVVGEVVSIGKNVTAYRIGDRVGAFVTTGAYAELVRAPQGSVFQVDADADAGGIVALICGYGTAYHALKQRANLMDGETLVVTGAAGLTGLAAVEIGKAMGAKVIAVASTPQKRLLASKHGADITIGYENLRDTLRSVSRRDGIDVVFDVVGGDTFDACARALGWGGRLLVVGFAGGVIPEFPVNLSLVKGYSIVGVFWGEFAKREPQTNHENMNMIMEYYHAGKLKPYIGADMPLAEAANALNLIYSRQAEGKIVLTP